MIASEPGADDPGQDALRQALLNAITERAWRDIEFRSMLFSDSEAALQSLFGEVPKQLTDVKFVQRPLDRALVRYRPEGRHLIVRPKRSNQLISALVRTIAGQRDLVVVFNSRRCQYQCSFCTLPTTSSHTLVEWHDLLAQLDEAFALADRECPVLDQISLGNEGSILDAATFPTKALEATLRRCSARSGVRSIVLETRSEFVTPLLLDQLRRWADPCQLTVKIGLESVSQDVRERILQKRMSLPDFERVVTLLGRANVRLSSYVLVKASPWHDDAEGRDDAIATCAYLKDLCQCTGTALELRINSMYRAAGSRWSKWAAQSQWTPPSIFDLGEVMWEVRTPDVAVYAGLSEEGLATPDGHYEARDDYQHWAREHLERYNETGAIELLRAVAMHRGRLSDNPCTDMADQ
jgi:radical SAM enzyme (TIGR01210 family)